MLKCPTVPIRLDRPIYTTKRIQNDTHLYATVSLPNVWITRIPMTKNPTTWKDFCSIIFFLSAELDRDGHHVVAAHLNVIVFTTSSLLLFTHAFSDVIIHCTRHHGNGVAGLSFAALSWHAWEPLDTKMFTSQKIGRMVFIYFYFHKILNPR